MVGLGPEEQPTLEQRVSALEELAKVALRTDPRGPYVASTARAEIDALYEAVATGDAAGRRHVSGVRAALKRLVGV